MILFNTTFLIETAAEENLLSCIKQSYIPMILANSILSDPALYRIHRPANADEGEDYSSFALHFYAPSLDLLEDYLQTKAQEHMQKSFASLGSKLLHFSSTMECLKQE